MSFLEQSRPHSRLPVVTSVSCHSPRTLTYPAGGADADDGDTGAAGMVQQLEELVQHDGNGRHAHAMLEPGRNQCHPHCCLCVLQAAPWESQRVNFKA